MIEDEQRIADAIVYALKREGYIVEVIYNGEEAIKKLQDKGRIGVIMLTAKEDIVIKILGLELGAGAA